jgi:putative salt-induced outer membrane protein
MRRRFLCAIFLMAAGVAAQADQVNLKNGDRLTGSIVSSDGKTLLIKTEFAGEVTLQWGAITEIESSDKLNLTLKDGKRLSGRITTREGKFVVADAPSDVAPKDNIVAVRNDAEQKAYDLAAERMAHPKFTYFWNGLFDTGLALTRGNSSTATFTLAAKAVRETPRDKLTLYSTYIYGDDNSVPPSRTTANALRAGVRGDYNLSPKVFVFALGDFETNELQHLDLRTVFGGGFGYHLIHTERTAFDVFGGITFDRDSFGAYTLTDSTTVPPTLTPVSSAVKNSAEAVVGEEFGTKFGERSTLTERFSFYPNLSHTGDYRMEFDSNMATQLNHLLSWQVTFSDRYISYPPTGLKANDILLSTGLRVTWGKAKL